MRNASGQDFSAFRMWWRTDWISCWKQIVNFIPYMQPPGGKMHIPVGGENGYKSQTVGRGLGIIENFLNLVIIPFQRLFCSFCFAYFLF